MILSSVGLTIIAGLGFWLIGGLLLRVGGVILVFAGAVGLAVSGELNGVLVVSIGGALWLAGHWHHALRHHGYKSPLARYVFCRWAPAWLDPTTDWAIAVAPDRAERDAAGERGPRT